MQRAVLGRCCTLFRWATEVRGACSCLPLLHKDSSDVQRRSVVPTPQRRAQVALRKPVNPLRHDCSVLTRELSHAKRLNHVGGAVQRGVFLLLFGEVLLAPALRTPLRGEVLVDQHDSTLEREQPTQPSVGSSPVASLHGKRELPVSIREHHGAVSPTLAFVNQTIDRRLFEMLLPPRSHKSRHWTNGGVPREATFLVSSQ